MRSYLAFTIIIFTTFCANAERVRIVPAQLQTVTVEELQRAKMACDPKRDETRPTKYAENFEICWQVNEALEWVVKDGDNAFRQGREMHIHNLVTRLKDKGLL